MKRLIKKANERWFHLTNEESFSLNADYENNQQEFGRGLYVSPLSNLRNWDGNLRGRNYGIEVFINNLNIIDESDFPSAREIANDILSHNFNTDQVHEELPTGNTFGRSKMDIATKRFWCRINNIDAIKPFEDSNEGPQIVIINFDKIQLGEMYSIEELYKLSRGW